MIVHVTAIHQTTVEYKLLQVTFFGYQVYNKTVRKTLPGIVTTKVQRVPHTTLFVHLTSRDLIYPMK